MSFNDIVVRNSEPANTNLGLKASRVQSKVIMSHVSAAQAQRLAYHEMNYGVYLAITLIFYGCIVALAMALGDIGTIIDFVSAYCISCMAFLIPAVFYRKAVVKFKVDQDAPGVKNQMMIALFMIPLGVLNFGLSCTSGIFGILGVTDGGGH